MNQSDDATAMVHQDSSESDAESSATRTDRLTLVGLAPLEDETSHSAAAGEAPSESAAPEPSPSEQAQPDIETSTVRPMQLLASEAAEQSSQADEPPATVSEPPAALEEEDPEWLDLSTRWLITPRPRNPHPLVDEDEVTEHLRWADQLVVRALPRAEQRKSVAPPPPPSLAAAHPSRRVTLAYGRPSELPMAQPYAVQPMAAHPSPITLEHGRPSELPAAQPYAMPPAAATAAPPWSASAPPTAEAPPPWAAAGLEPRAHYPSHSRAAFEERHGDTPTGYTPFETGSRRRSRRRPKPSELSVELWQSISDTWLATAFKWAIALVMLHYSGLAVPVMALFGYAPAQTALAANSSVVAVQPAAAPVAAAAAPAAASVIPDDLSRRYSVQREVSESSETFTRHYPTRTVHKPRALNQHRAAPVAVAPVAPAPVAPAPVAFASVAPVASQQTKLYASAVQPLLAAEPESDDAAGEAFLRINSRPWSQVFVDGTHVGHTPKIDLRVRAGAHRIRFVNSELGVSKTVEVRASPGETVSHVQFLED